jgi:CheY-like chemotaxis protein
MSRIEEDKLKIDIAPANLYSILDEIRGNFTFFIREKRLEYLQDIDPAVPQYLNLDKLRLKQVLINLINNAIKYTEKGYVKLIVKKENRQVDKSKIDLVFAVEDTGIGIDSGDREKLFEPFERFEGKDKKVYDGFGLGLSISKKIIELMGGDISVDSKKGKGSTFTFVLRNVRAASDQTSNTDGDDFDSSGIVFEKQKLLVVDDHQDMREIIKGYLENTNIQVVEAEDGHKVLQSMKEYKIDLILMDLAMPGMDGIETTKKIREDKTLKDIPILAFTASKTEPGEVEKYRELFDRYLFKPVSKAKLFFELSHFLKLKKKTGKEEEPEKIEELEMIELHPENIKLLPEIIGKLNEYRELWEIACTSNNFNEYKNFGLKIKELGEKYFVNVLSHYGDAVISNAEMYEIDKITSVLDEYPGLIEKLKLYDKEQP